MDGSVEAGARAGALLAATGVAAVLSGSPFLSPSLGPSAYLLATAPQARASRPRKVLGGHAVGVVAGLLATHLVSPGLVVIDPLPSLSPGLVRLDASAIVSVVLTTGGILATRA